MSILPTTDPISLNLDRIPDEKISKEEKEQMATFIKGVLASGQTESCEFKKSKTGLARTIVFISKDEIYILLNSQKKSDQVLGTGTSKTLKTALNVISGQACATYSVKMNPELLQELEFRKMFREIDHVQNPAISTLDYVSKKGQKTRVFDGLYSSDLTKIIARDETEESKIPDAQKKQMAKDLILALKGIHDKGFFHRDIKPENILIQIQEDGGISCDLADFDITVRCDDKDSQMVKRGSPKYLSPEYIAYGDKELIDPPERLALLEEKRKVEEELLAIIDPEKKAKGSGYGLQLMKYKRSNPADTAKVDDLDKKIKTLLSQASDLRPIRDYACVTTKAHDNYALGLSLYAAFTSQKALDSFLEKRDSDIDAVPSFDGYSVEPALQEVLIGLLDKDPVKRITLEDALRRL
jgi:serine/threonine protein kinase